MKFCKDCKHLATYYFCMREIFTYADPIVGPLAIYAGRAVREREQRSLVERVTRSRERCGPDAIHFEEKVP